jgi:hypothetical protein
MAPEGIVTITAALGRSITTSSPTPGTCAGLQLLATPQSPLWLLLQVIVAATALLRLDKRPQKRIIVARTVVRKDFNCTVSLTPGLSKIPGILQAYGF